VGVASGSFTAPDHEYPSYLEIQLTATDSRGATDTKSVSINPQTVALNFASVPSGLQLVVGSSSSTTPFSRTVIVGSGNSISADTPQTLGDSLYQFSTWSDGGAQTHNITAGATAATYTATYSLSGPVLGLSTVGSVLDSGDSNYLNGSKVTVGGTSVSVTGISVYVGTVDTAPNNQYQVGIYTDQNGTPGTLVASSTSGTLTPNAWNTRPLAAPLQANTSYWLMYNTNGRSAAVNNMYYKASSAGQGAYSKSKVAFGSWPTPFGAATLTNGVYSLYTTTVTP